MKELDTRLRQLPPAEVLRIHRAFEHELLRSYRWELWGAAYVINGGCSDDCFDYFRGWLLLQGKDVFDAALRDPDTLVTVRGIADSPELEAALSLTPDAYRSMTGQEPTSDAERPPLGPGWDFDDASEMMKRYPKLSARFSTR